MQPTASPTSAPTGEPTGEPSVVPTPQPSASPTVAPTAVTTVMTLAFDMCVRLSGPALNDLRDQMCSEWCLETGVDPALVTCEAIHCEDDDTNRRLLADDRELLQVAPIIRIETQVANIASMNVPPLPVDTMVGLTMKLVAHAEADTGLDLLSSVRLITLPPTPPPTLQPTPRPTLEPTTPEPTAAPVSITPTSSGETFAPTPGPTPEPTQQPSVAPTPEPSTAPTSAPTACGPRCQYHKWIVSMLSQSSAFISGFLSE